ncbi:ATP-binding protein [Aspergillus undulatus]|uniref:ATP-binding protein n=1 Tax=Aspergillus undulatus TaxID=1810928 RepID=UPI003CCCE5D5
MYAVPADSTATTTTEEPSISTAENIPTITESFAVSTPTPTSGSDLAGSELAGGEGGNESSAPEPSPEIKAEDRESGSGTNVGVIAGGVVGGVAGLALIVLAVWFILRRQKKKNAELREIGAGYIAPEVNLIEACSLGTLMVSVNEAKQGSSEDREKSLQALVKILKPSKTDSAQDWYDKLTKARVPGTGDWIRSENTFRSWLSRENPIIFVSGNPGAGKSYLATNIISFLREEHPQHVQSTCSVSIGYIFFKDDNPDTRSFHQALRDLAFQISKNDPVYQKYLASIEDHERLSTLESAWRLLFVEYFLNKTNIQSSVYILIDAVDEALDNERSVFFRLAKDLYEARQQSRLQLAVVGRPHISDQLLEGVEVEAPTIHVTAQNNSHDINFFIHASIKKSAVLRRASAKLRQDILDKLSVGADGIIRKALEDPPKGLKQILRHVLLTFSASCSAEELEYLNEILAWVTTAQQPLTTGKIDAILKLKSPDGDGMIYLEGALRRQFASFFNLNREDGLNTAELQNMSTRPDLFDASDDEEKQEDETFEDVDNFTDFNSDGKTTTVTFSHASIGDFFRDEAEGPVSAGDDYTSVGVNYRQAKAHVLKTFLRLFTDKEFAQKADDQKAMLQHAAEHWVYHLQNTAPSQCSSEDREEIAKMLLTAFRSEESMYEWIGPRRWLPTRENIEPVRKWWRGDILDSLSQEDRDFISATEENPLTTFRPVAMFCTRQWLCNPVWRVAPVAAVPWAYQKLDNGLEVDFFTDFNPTADELKAVEMDGQVAEILSKQIRDDPDGPQTLKVTLHKVLERMADCYVQLGELDKRFKVIKQAHETTIPYCSTCINLLFEHYGTNQNHAAVIDLLEQLDQTSFPGRNHSLFTQALLDTPDHDYNFFLSVADAALATDNLGLMVRVWRTAAKAAREALQTVTAAVLELSIGRIYNEYAHDQSKSIKRWEKILDTYASAEEESEIGIAKMEAACLLARQLLCDAVEAGIGTPEAAPIGAKLERLARRRMSETGLDILWTLDSVRAISLGVYYRLNGQEAEAQAQFRPSIKRGIEILSDDDPSNDLYGLVDLFNALIAAGDSKNVIAIAYALGTVTEGTDEEGFAWNCAGPCRKASPVLDGFSTCPICFSTAFCGDCIELLEEGTMGIKRCNAKHLKDFVYIPSPPQEIPKGSMLLDGEVIGFEDWKSQLRSEWKI